MSPPKPALHFVHGSYHSQNPTWTGLRAALESRRYETLATDLPSMVVSPVHPSDHLQNVTAVQEALIGLVAKGRQALLIAHSYGGVPTSSAFRGFGTQVVRIKSVDALLVPVGKSAVDVASVGRAMPKQWRRIINEHHMEFLREHAREAFYSVVSAQET